MSLVPENTPEDDKSAPGLKHDVDGDTKGTDPSVDVGQQSLDDALSYSGRAEAFGREILSGMVGLPVEQEKRVKNHQLDFPMVREYPEDDRRLDTDVLIPILPDTPAAIEKRLETLRGNSLDKTEETQSWVETILESFKSSPGAGLFEDRLDDPEAKWVQRILHKGGQVGGIGKPSMKTGGTTELASRRAVLAARARLNIGAPINTTFVNSGFSATSEPISEREIVRLWSRIIGNADRLGRRTHGMLFSNSQVYTEQAVYEEWLGSLAMTSIKDLDLSKLVDILVIDDMKIISHAVATSMYPNGLPFVRAVWSDDQTLPKKEIKQVLDISKCLVIDESSLTQEQLDHLVRRREDDTTVEQVKKYQDSLVFRNRNSVVELDEGIKVTLRTPTLRQYFETGDRWISELNQIAREALGDKITDGSRNKYVEKLQRASRLCKYAHYVKSVEIDDTVYETDSGIRQLLEAFSARDWVAEKFYTGITDYINASQLSIVATQSFNEYEDKVTLGTKFPRLIPLDATSIFFQLVEQKLRGIVSREKEDM
jgi:hypothetical protein